MFRCKVCGWIHEGATPPDACPSCGASTDRFRAMDASELGSAVRDFEAHGIVGQGYEVEVEDTRRIRLLAFVDASFFSPYMRRSGKSYPIYTGDAQWFSDNIPCMTACPSHTDISRYIALIADGRYADSYELNREHNVFPGCLGRMCARPCEEACRRKEVDAPIGICYLKRVAADYRGATRREIPAPWNGMTAAIIGAGVDGLTTARQLARKGYSRHHFREAAGAGRRDVDRCARVAPAARCHHRRSRADSRARHRDSLQHRNRQRHPLQELVDDYDVVVDLCRLPGAAGDRHSRRGSERRGLRICNSSKMSISAQKDVWVGKKVVTVGGGFTSMDCVRTVMRMGAETSVMTYRRSIQEIPVDEIELEEAEIEGVEIMYMVVADPGRRR